MNENEKHVDRRTVDMMGPNTFSFMYLQKNPKTFSEKSFTFLTFKAPSKDYLRFFCNVVCRTKYTFSSMGKEQEREGENL